MFLQSQFFIAIKTSSVFLYESPNFGKLQTSLWDLWSFSPIFLIGKHSLLYERITDFAKDDKSFPRDIFLHNKSTIIFFEDMRKSQVFHPLVGVPDQLERNFYSRFLVNGLLCSGLQPTFLKTYDMRFCLGQRYSLLTLQAASPKGFLDGGVCG